MVPVLLARRDRLCHLGLPRSVAWRAIPDCCLQVRSYGVGNHVKLPGPSAKEPNKYDFGTPYQYILDDLRRKDEALYTRNGLIQVPCGDRVPAAGGAGVGAEVQGGTGLMARGSVANVPAGEPTVWVAHVMPACLTACLPAPSLTDVGAQHQGQGRTRKVSVGSASAV